MKTVILPGYSPHNRQWAVDIKKDLNLGHEVLVHEWKHWSGKGSLSVSYEVGKILEKLGNGKVNVIAKSVGTRIALQLVAKIPGQINKVILCGIPTKGESEVAKKNYASLGGLSPTRVIVFQNTKDPFANYKIIKKFVGSINPKIKVIEKPRSDHHYPYSGAFQKFLK